MQNLQVRSTLSPRIRELEKQYSRYDIDRLLLAEGYTPAIIEDAWKRKDYKEEFNQTVQIPRYKANKAKRKLTSRPSIMGRFWHIFLTFLVLLLAIGEFFAVTGLFFTHRWYLVNEAKLIVSDLHKLTEYRDWTLVLGFTLILSMTISNLALFPKKQRQSLLYIALMVYHLLLFLGTVWLFFQFTTLPDKYYW